VANPISKYRLAHSALVAGFASMLMGCAPEAEVPDPNAITIGALLPFTGKEAAIGRNLEQALLLAVDDVNRAGGVGGRTLRVISRDSNSGSRRGFDELLQLLYTDEVAYLIGPEENELVNAIVPDVKGLDVLNILPGYAAPPVQQTGSRGAWLRLAPSPAEVGCAMAKQAVRDGVKSMNALITLDDYNLTLATDFSSQFRTLKGESLPSITVPAGESSYVRQIDQAFAYGAERTLLMAYPATASTITTEWTITGRRGAWYLSPLLRAEAFVQNIPFGALNGTAGLSPSLSLVSECTTADAADQVSCRDDNANAFAQHFSNHWNGDRPLPAAHYYYDAAVLLALGLSRALADTDEMPSAVRLRNMIRDLGDKEDAPVYWGDLSGPLAEVAGGSAVYYVGAAAEYQFDRYGAAQHVIFDTWAIQNDGFKDTGSLKAVCPKAF
jgi:neutral amino acid transport system substrate-binding protein